MDPQPSPVEVWAGCGFWPPDFYYTSQPVVELPSGAYSVAKYAETEHDDYDQRPQGSDPAHQTLNMVMDTTKGLALVSKRSLFLCQEVLGSVYPPHDPYYTLITGTLRAVTSKPHQDSENIGDQVNVPWDGCDLCEGSKPTPSVAVGILPAGFTIMEHLLLDGLRQRGELAGFGSIYFPFLLYQLGSEDETMKEVERRNMHNASIAVKSLLHFYQYINPSLCKDCNNSTVVFSISQTVKDGIKMHGHFAVTKGLYTTYHRHKVLEIPADAMSAGELDDKVQKLAQAIYKVCVPDLMKRIRSCLIIMTDTIKKQREEKNLPPYDPVLDTRGH